MQVGLFLREIMLSRWYVCIAPLFVFLMSYLVTTVFAATLYMLPGGGGYLANRSGPIVDDLFSAVGSPMYIALLYLPLIVTPIFAGVTIFLCSKVSKKIILSAAVLNPKIDTRALALIFVLAVLFCTFRLYQIDAFDFGVVSAGDYVEKTVRRLYLLEELGYVFFMFAYGVNAILPILAYLAFVMQGERSLDFLLFCLSFFSFVFFITATYSKAQILVYLILAVVAFVLTRSKLRYIFFVSAICVGSFLLTGYAMQSSSSEKNVIAEEQSISISEKNVIAEEQSISISEKNVIAEEQSISISEKNSEGGAGSIADAKGLISYVDSLMGVAFHRMAAAVPYYVVIFEDSEERCGIQGGAIRRLLRFPESACVLPIKIFNFMYPEVDWAQGQQPAPASLSAYGELGFAWSIIVMALSGVLLGALGVIGAVGRGPLYIGFVIASCSFAYYLTQVSFVASFTYPHGLIVFMIPVVILFVISFFRGEMVSKKSHRKSA